uniref:Uncharacterized protein n=1 Tax=Triticum urartu TaxID=4572 RepID=A0A8R7V549_TRIUA
MTSTVCRSADEASSRRTMAALARAARSPWESTETRVLREAGEAMQRRASSSSGKNTVSAARIFPSAPRTAALVPSTGSPARLWKADESWRAAPAAARHRRLRSLSLPIALALAASCPHTGALPRLAAVDTAASTSAASASATGTLGVGTRSAWLATHQSWIILRVAWLGTRSARRTGPPVTGHVPRPRASHPSTLSRS